MKHCLRNAIVTLCMGFVLFLGTGCAAWEAAKVPFDKFSRVMSGESRYEKKMDRYQRAVDWEREYEQMKENRTLPPAAETTGESKG